MHWKSSMGYRHNLDIRFSFLLDTWVASVWVPLLHTVFSLQYFWNPEGGQFSQSHFILAFISVQYCSLCEFQDFSLCCCSVSIQTKQSTSSWLSSVKMQFLWDPTATLCSAFQVCIITSLKTHWCTPPHRFTTSPLGFRFPLSHLRACMSLPLTSHPLHTRDGFVFVFMSFQHFEWRKCSSVRF